jgi:SAM-dependent methyltransferase
MNPAEKNHAHSLETLNILYEYDDFMESIDTLIDLGCGTGEDLEWWATRTTRDDDRRPLNIKCTGVDILSSLPVAKKYSNISYQFQDFEEIVPSPKKNKFNLLWCHDAFQYAINPIQTLIKWRNIASENAMLILILPQTTNIDRRSMSVTQTDGCYYHYSLVNLIHMLAITGWDCRNGFFLKKLEDNWLHAVVYKSDQEPLDPKNTRWYDLMEKNLLPDSANNSINRYGYLQQQDLVLPWLDKSLTSYFY